MSSENQNIIERTTKDLTEYVNLRIDKFSLSLLENLSKLVSSLFSVILAALLATIALLTFAGALIMIVAAWVGSVIWALLIVGLFFTIVAIIIFAIGDRLVINRVVNRLSKAMMDLHKKDDDYEQN